MKELFSMLQTLKKTEVGKKSGIYFGPIATQHYI